MSASVLPPAYSSSNPVDRDNGLANISGDPVGDLPAYSPSTRPAPTGRPATLSVPPKEYNHSLRVKGKVFAELTIVAGGNLSKSMPTFVTGQPIKGRVNLYLDKPDSFKSIVVHIEGRLLLHTPQGIRQIKFIEISQPVWSQAMGDPRDSAQNFRTRTNASNSSTARRTSNGPSSATIGNDSSPNSPISRAAVGLPPKFTDSLPEGDYVWDFSIELPKEIAHNNSQVSRLPQTFNEATTGATIEYDVWAKFHRNNLVKNDPKLVVPFAYVPLVTPPALSPLRRLAYQESTHILGPSVDPEGWHALSPVRVKGKLFNSRMISVGCTLFLAKPTSYTRGSVIPLCIELQGDDTQALDLLSSPKSIIARLRRRVILDTKDSMNPKPWTDISQLALWWPSAEGLEPGRRIVNGELLLPLDLMPTSLVMCFRVEYAVVLFPFDSPGFGGSSVDQLLELPVDIVTAYAPGPRSKSMAPPGYKSSLPVMQADTATLLMANWAGY